MCIAVTYTPDNSSRDKLRSWRSCLSYTIHPLPPRFHINPISFKPARYSQPPPLPPLSLSLSLSQPVRASASRAEDPGFESRSRRDFSRPPPPSLSLNRLDGLVVKASASRAEDPGFESRLRWDFSGRVESYQWQLTLQWLPFQVPGDIESVLGLVGPVSVYCDWLR